MRVCTHAAQADDGVVLEQDLLVCRVQVMLTRPSHMATGFNPDSIKGKAALVGRRRTRAMAAACTGTACRKTRAHAACVLCHALA